MVRKSQIKRVMTDTTVRMSRSAGERLSHAFMICAVTSAEGTKTYKVTFTDAEGTDSEVFFNEKGEVLK